MELQEVSLFGGSVFPNKPLIFERRHGIIKMELNGGVAHPGERLSGRQEVVGSIPISSTNNNNKLAQYIDTKNKCSHTNMCLFVSELIDYLP